jgi:hypothetical protein
MFILKLDTLSINSPAEPPPGLGKLWSALGMCHESDCPKVAHTNKHGLSPNGIYLMEQRSILVLDVEIGEIIDSRIEFNCVLLKTPSNFSRSV